MDEPAQECSAGQNDGLAQNRAAVGEPDAGNRPIGTLAVEPDLVRFPFHDCQTVDGGDFLLHGLPIEFPVGLCPGPSHGRPLAAVQHAELDAAPVRDPSHQTVERIDLPNQVTLPQSADRGIAGHHSDGIETVRDQGGGRARTGSGSGSLTARMAATDHHDVKCQFQFAHVLYRAHDLSATIRPGQCPFRNWDQGPTSRQTITGWTGRHRVAVL
ncbi:UNVERIFIED_CONTAM: hypothetical protein GTU68_061651 [Idotea baltica]|nr:hypothetical protein [Idotea baltica]